VTCRHDIVGSKTYRLCPTDPPRAADQLRAVVRWLAVDEIRNAGPDVGFTVTTESLGLRPRVAQDGIMGLVGNPARLYPGLDAATVDIAFSVAAPGYLTRDLQVTLGPIPGFPDQFAPADAGIVYLHRQPVVLRGRVVQLGGLEPTPMLGVPIRIAGVWSSFPPAHIDPDTVMEQPNLVALHPGLYADRSAADSLTRRNLDANPGQDKVLALPAAASGNTARLSDRVGLAPGSILAFEPGVPGRVEYIAVTVVSGASTDDQQATVTLAHPLKLLHEEGTTVQVMTPQAAVAVHALTRDGVPGDRVAFLVAMGGVDAGVVEIGGGSAPVEYQTASLYSTVSDGDGYYRLPPLSRVASVKLHADQAPAQEPTVSLDYGRYENFVDVVYP